MGSIFPNSAIGPSLFSINSFSLAIGSTGESGFPIPTPILAMLFPNGKIQAYPAGEYFSPTINHHVSELTCSTLASYSAPAPNLSHCSTNPIDFATTD